MKYFISKCKYNSNMTRLEYLELKRLDVLKQIKPICEAFGIEDYDYIVKDNMQRETLRIGNTYIGCSENSMNAIVQELVGYIFLTFNKECYYGAFQKQFNNQVRRYWLDEKRKKDNNFI